MIMPPERLTHSALFLTGEVHALLMFAQALARSHPNRPGLRAHFEQASQVGLASLEQLPAAGDVTIDGYQFAVGAIRQILEGPSGVR
jgi:hypothetical protein